MANRFSNKQNVYIITVSMTACAIENSVFLHHFLPLRCRFALPLLLAVFMKLN